MTNIRSSYIQNNFGELFENIVKARKVENIVELGVLDGYSTLHLAKFLPFNKKHYDIDAHLDAYDLFEDYPYKHGNMQEVQSLLNEYNLQEFVTLYKADAFEVHTKYADNSVHLLHVDLSNTGDILKRIMQNWHQKMMRNGIILFEGGSTERDDVAWMKKYNMPSIKHEIETNEIINNHYIYSIYEKFPSLTMLMKTEGDLNA
jgi:predicted O-methyltransferase YrrM